MKVEVLDKKGKKIEDLTLSKEVFGVEANPSLIAQYVHVYKTNQRQGTSSIKTRAEVSGGGRKPWRQKGTGRARHGSIRSPIWVGGGISHGPKPKSFQKKLPKKMRKKAMAVVLSDKLNEKSIKVIDSIKMTKPKTKDMEKIIKNLSLEGKILVVTDKADKNVVKSVSNLPIAEIATFDTVNVYQILNAKSVLFEKAAIKSLEKRYK